MNVFVISDLHLSYSVPEKSMEFFGDTWKNYHEKIKTNWLKKIKKEDIVLIPGDICWAMKLKDALVDLEEINKLPGIKIILKGNHDYWWASNAKMIKALPPSIKFIQNNSINIGDVSIAGSRLWDTNEYNFDEYIDFKHNPNKKDLEEKIQKELQEKIFLKELERLKSSLSQMNKNAKIKIVMTHYPPISATLKDSKVSKILEEFNVDICVFGHLHSVKKNALNFGIKNKIKYIFASCDYIDFDPIKIL
ncbi:MAG: 3',5'-cyclic adenosine monophosphate phosphodiesterase CpdA [Candidatus Anoxychlamydiales bacterium]|nr:3',5'-cyclic adenosine monophosphate phosphodiesterase CpdA [Candidatus Anoxychlamydiales bacterium]